MGEFELIQKYFAGATPTRADVVTGIGDDAAVTQLPPSHELVITTDTLVAGVHFPDGTAAADIGHKALAVNLSDLAAMGADPVWFTLNLTLPSLDTEWLRHFSGGIAALAREFGVQLIGGDTTRGPLAVGITAFGTVPRGSALYRRGARPGDRVYITGHVGDAAVALRVLQHGLHLPAEYQTAVLQQLHRPSPRVREGLALRGLASACIDISDGLVADLGHVLTASGVGATLDLKRLAVSPAYESVLAEIGWELALTHGDDYELCFTLPLAHLPAFNAVSPRFACGFSHIGDIDAELGLRIRDEAGAPYVPRTTGYDHFRDGAFAPRS